MSRRFRFATLAVVFCAFAARAEQGKRPASVLVGATLPLTGSEAKAGTMFREGYELAIERENADGGLLVGGGRVPVTLRLLDDGSSAANAVKLAEQLVQEDHADFLLSTYSSSLVEPQSAVAERLRIPYVSGAASATTVFQHGYKYLFGLQSPIDQLANALLRWIDEQQKSGKLPSPLRIALVWEKTAHGKDYRSGVQDFVGKTASRRGSYQVVLDDSFDLNTKDFGPLLKRIQAARADVVLADAHLPDFIQMQKQYVAAGMCHKLVSYGARGAEKEAAQALPPHATDYVLSAVWWNAQLGAKGLTKEFVDLFRARYGRTPEWYQALAYESARALFTAVEQAGTTDREAVREALAALKMESIVPGGYLTFPQEYGQQAHYLFVVQQNQPDGTSPIVYPKIAAVQDGIPADPRCSAHALR